MKLELLEHSTSPGKKFKAVFRLDNGKTKTTHFGAAGMEDFTIHKNEERKKHYIQRHRVTENFTDPTTAGALSRWILWNKPSFSASLADFKRRFHL